LETEPHTTKRAKTTGRLSSSMRHLLQRVLLTLMKHPTAVAFIYPVNTVQVPDYLTVISRPMDFSTIQNQLEAGVYSTHEEFARDVRQIFYNCWTYNMQDSLLFNSATALASVFEYLYLGVQNHQQQAKQDEVVVEMEKVINQLRDEHTKLINELHKLKTARNPNALPPTPPQPKRAVTKQPKKPPKQSKVKKEKKEKKSPKVRPPQTSTPKINTLPIVYKYEYNDRERLSKKINSLTVENLQKMVELLSADIAEFQNITGELEIDLEKLSDASLSRLEQFADDCIKQQESGSLTSNADSNIAGTNDSDSSDSGSESEDED